VRGAGGQRRQAGRGLGRELALADRQGGRAAEQSRRRLRQAVEPECLELDLPVQADDADLGEGDRGGEADRHPQVSEASEMVAPPVQDFDGAFQTMVVSEASTSPATFSRALASPTRHGTGCASRRLAQPPTRGYAGGSTSCASPERSACRTGRSIGLIASLSAPASDPPARFRVRARTFGAMR
jgi:hypothetical protein